MKEAGNRNSSPNLKAQNTLLKVQLEKLDKKYKELLREKESNINSLILNARRKTESREWELFVDEMAHTFNTDIFITQSALLRLESSPDRKTAFEHLKHIRELNDLIMWYLKRKDFFRQDDEIVTVDIREVYQRQLNTVKEGITTLRLSIEEHQEKLEKLVPDYSESGNCRVKLSKPISKVFDLIIKDLLKNAFKNTDDENPGVKVVITGHDNEVEMALTNNRLMPIEFKQWFVGDANIEPEISKSSKVGLRILKRWLTLLRIDYNVELDEANNTTSVIIYIPKEIKIE